MFQSKGFILLALPLLLAACTDSTPKARPLGKFDKKIKAAFREEPAKQLAAPGDWFLKSPDLDGLEGVAATRAYQELGIKTGKTIVVAVIDSGVDIRHEDLQGKIWKNVDEIPDNGIDDDGNGYVDDIHGWNFLGGHDANGKPTHIASETLEVTRELNKMKAKKEAQGGVLSVEDQAYLDKVQKEVTDARTEATEEIVAIDQIVTSLKTQFEILKDVVGVSFEKLTLAAVESVKSSDTKVIAAKNEIVAIFKKAGVVDTARLLNARVNAQTSLDAYYNENFNARAEIVGDDPENYADHSYGNNDVVGPEADHGTHVSGLIAASRGNGVGMDGVATDVLIMALRAVPDGDERDKDVANAVRYAADNGAQIINMSFGKSYSPGKSAVDAAFVYAESKGVLIFHSAGNSSKDNDLGNNFPNRHILSQAGRSITTWIEVGASDAMNDFTLPAIFSNYGQKDVDLFSPGVRVNSTTPNNTYAAFSGTSMAGPVAAGVAALVLSQKPELTAQQLREEILASTRKRGDLMVRLPGSNPVELVPFARLSATGGVVDAYAALKRVMGL